MGQSINQLSRNIVELLSNVHFTLDTEIFLQSGDYVWASMSVYFILAILFMDPLE